MDKKTIGNFIMFFLSAGLCFMLMHSCAFVDRREAKIDPARQNNTHKFFYSIRPYRGDSESHYRFGCYLQERNKHRLAVQEFMKSVEIDPANVKAYNGLGISYDSLGDFDQAMESFQKALELDPGLDYVYNNLGYAYLRNGSPDQAIESFRQAVALESEKELYHNNLGLAYVMKEQYDRAPAGFKLAMSESKARTFLSRILDRPGLPDKAGRQTSVVPVENHPDKDQNEAVEATRVLAMIFSAGQMEDEGALKPDTYPPDEDDHAGAKNTYTVLAGSFKFPVNAEIRKTTLIEQGYEAMVQKKGEEGNTPLYAVEVGLFQNRQEAIKTARRIRVSEGIQAVPVPAVPARNFKTGKLSSMDVKPAAPDFQHKIKQPPSSVIRIEVSNGNGVNRMARKVGEYLRSRGFVPRHLTNAENFNKPKTCIYYSRGYHDQAREVARYFPGDYRMEMVPSLPWSDTDVRVVIGKDLMPFLQLFQTI